jgi:antitoxin component YwqK of YwqJK toxin-antitoxin module
MNKIICLIASIVIISGCIKKETKNDTDYIITYYPNGSVNEILQKKKGLLNGKSFKFHEDGTKFWEYNYVNDQMNGLQYNYSHGKLRAINSYVNNELHGWARHFSGDCEILTKEGQYEGGNLNGLWYEYYGRELLEINFFKNDSLVKVIYRNKKYPDRNIPLPPLSKDCGGVWTSGEQ